MNPFQSLPEYEHLVYTLQQRYPSIITRSTLVIARRGRGLATLASTNPHHKHIPPNIQRHRVPAPGLSFSKPNLPFLIKEIERHRVGNGSTD